MMNELHQGNNWLSSIIWRYRTLAEALPATLMTNVEFATFVLCF
jgi:hypothetical protein